MRMNDTENTTSDFLYYNYDYSPCSTDANLTLGSGFKPALLLTVFFLSLTGNSVVLWVLVWFIKLKSLTDVCLLNLAISDLMVALSLPLWAYIEQVSPNVGLCKVIAGVYQMGLYSGLLFVCLMSVDRYLAIVHAVAAMRARTLRYGVIASAVIWITSMFSALPELVFTGVFEEDDTLSCQQLYPAGWENTFKLLRNFVDNAMVFLFSLPIMLFCYSRILAVLLRSRNSNKHRAMRLIFAIVGLFMLSWIPYSVVVFLFTLQELDIWNTCEMSAQRYLALTVTESITLVHCCVNPVIYAFVGEKFRRPLSHLLSRMPFCAQHRQTSAMHTTVTENEMSDMTV